MQLVGAEQRQHLRVDRSLIIRLRVCEQAMCVLKVGDGQVKMAAVDLHGRGGLINERLVGRREFAAAFLHAFYTLLR